MSDRTTGANAAPAKTPFRIAPVGDGVAFIVEPHRAITIYEYDLAVAEAWLADLATAVTQARQCTANCPAPTRTATGSK